MKLSKYPKKCISSSQFSDEKKIRKQEKEEGKAEKCSCGSTEFMITTLGIRICASCYNPVGFIL